MLERNAERGPLGATPRIALYAGAGVLVLGLLSTLAWLVHENQGTNDALRVVEQAAVVPIPDPPALAGLATAAPGAEAPASPATIVEDPQPAAAPKLIATAAAQAAPTVPPLVLLSAEEAGAKRDAKPGPASAPRPQPVREVPPAPEPAQAHHTQTATVAKAAELPQAHRAQPTTVAKAAELARAHRAQPATVAKAPARPRTAAGSGPATTPATTAAPKAVARAAAAKTKKQQPAASPTRPELASDHDVALISAIISHSSRHAHERAPGDADAGCGAAGDKKCPAHPGSAP